jgi:hypothetical protein
MLWSLFFRAMYRFLRLLDPVLRAVWRRGLPLFGRIVDLRVVGRRTGRARRTLVTLLTVRGAWYVGHPNGGADWTSNLAAGAGAELGLASGESRRVSAVRVDAGPEREAVIRATWSQQPFPGNVIYAVARRHVRAVGVYFRLNPLDAAPTGTSPPA